MNKTFTILLLSLVVMVAGAQDYEKFKVGLSVGYGSLSRQTNQHYTVGHLSIEPAYNINNKLTIGMRLEATGGHDTDDLVDVLSATVNSQYYFSNNNRFRPFAGIGIGMYANRTTSVVGTYPSFGFYPRVGFDVGHFSMMAEYNFVIPPYTESYVTGYLAIKVGFVIGGGRK